MHNAPLIVKLGMGLFLFGKVQGIITVILLFLGHPAALAFFVAYITLIFLSLVCAGIQIRNIYKSEAEEEALFSENTNSKPAA